MRKIKNLIFPAALSLLVTAAVITGCSYSGAGSASVTDAEGNRQQQADYELSIKQLVGSIEKRDVKVTQSTQGFRKEDNRT